MVCYAGQREGKVTLSYGTCGNSQSCGVSAFPVSPLGYLVLWLFELYVCLWLFVSAVWPEFLTLSFVVQAAVKTHSSASHISSFWFCLSARLPPAASVTKAAQGLCARCDSLLWHIDAEWCMFELGPIKALTAREEWVTLFPVPGNALFGTLGSPWNRADVSSSYTLKSLKVLQWRPWGLAWDPNAAFRAANTEGEWL